MNSNQDYDVKLASYTSDRHEGIYGLLFEKMTVNIYGTVSGDAAQVHFDINYEHPNGGKNGRNITFYRDERRNVKFR